MSSSPGDIIMAFAVISLAYVLCVKSGGYDPGLVGIEPPLPELQIPDETPPDLSGYTDINALNGPETDKLLISQLPGYSAIRPSCAGNPSKPNMLRPTLIPRQVKPLLNRELRSAKLPASLLAITISPPKMVRLFTFKHNPVFSMILKLPNPTTTKTSITRAFLRRLLY